MSSAVKEDEPADPVDIGLLSAQAVMLDPAVLSNLNVQAGIGANFHGRVPPWIIAVFADSDSWQVKGL